MRAYSVFEVRSVDDDQRIIEGIATTPKTDRVGDIVEPKGAQFGLPLPFLWQHDRRSPIGSVVKADVTDKGIRVKVQIEKDDVPGPLKDLLDLAWRTIKKGLVRGLSIGFKPIESADINGTWGVRFIKWDWLELSAVTIPANMDASIQTIKTLSGNDPTVFSTGFPQSPSVLGPVNTYKTRGSPMNNQQRIAELENAKDLAVQRMDQINEITANDDYRGKDEAERAEFDKLAAQLKQIDAELADRRIVLTAQSKAATTVVATDTATGSQARSQRIAVKSRDEPGMGFARVVQAMVAAKTSGMGAHDIARKAWPDHPEVAKEIEIMQWKAAAAAGTTTDSTWAGPLAVIQPLASEFIGILRPLTLIGRIPGLRNVPFNSKVPRQDSSGTAHWVAQNAPKPVTVMAFSSVDFPIYKMSKICVLTKELVAISNPSALPLVRDSMVETLVQFMDTQFILSTVALSAGVNPASITNGVTGTASSGTAEANMRQDLRVLAKSFSDNNIPLSEVTFVTSEGIAFQLATAVNALGQTSFPNMGVTGGTLYGVTTVASNAVTEAQIVGVHAPSVLVGEEDGLEISVSEEATLQMDDAPTNPPTSVTVLESLWQTNRVGIRVERFAGWLKARSSPAPVNRIHTIAYV